MDKKLRDVVMLNLHPWLVPAESGKWRLPRHDEVAEAADRLIAALGEAGYEIRRKVDA